LAKLIVGVLAIQGDFQAHLDVIIRLGAEFREVRNPLDMESVTHLIIPGGESSTIRKVALANGLWEPLKGFKGPMMGTCMGSIMMAKKILSPDSDGWGMVDMTIKRNAYGRQINSFTESGRISFLDQPFEMVFIRAPKIVGFGHGVQPIAWLGDEITGVRAGNKLALTFHPELSGSPAADGLHKYFLGLK
jgi:pyridoxal 5'-phosphate synthase pdxT subunit